MNGKRRMAIVAAVIGLALLALNLAQPAGADGPAIWVEKCPTLHYEVRIEPVDKGAVLVSCVRMAEEVER